MAWVSHIRGLRINTDVTNDLLRIMRENAERIRSFGVARLGLFGSSAAGALREDSDLDFVVDFSYTTFDNYMDLKVFLEELFGRRVDLVVADAVKPRLRERIIKEAVHVAGL